MLYNGMQTALKISCLLVATVLGAVAFSVKGESVDRKRRFSAPLDIPLSLSGNYGELRGGRFHAGVDFRAYGRTGDPVRAVDSGYVSRISVSPTGYGNGVYVTHPDGLCTVYGHLSRFAPELEERVRREQYARKSFSVSLELAPEDFPVSAGSIIGYVGNSGSSGAPHLHLEVRNPQNDGPLNPLDFGVAPVQDRIPPEISRIRFFGCFSDSTGVVFPEEIASFRYGAPGLLRLPPVSYLSVEAVDRQDGTPAKLGISEYRLFLDDSLLYCYRQGNYEFREMSSFNSLIEYGAWVRGSGKGIKTWVEPGNDFRYRAIRAQGDGLIRLQDTQEHRLRLELEDEHGNVSRRSFRVRLDAERYRRQSVRETEESEAGNSRTVRLFWYRPALILRDGLELAFLPGSFYRDVRIAVERDSSGGAFPVWRIGTPEVPLKRPARLRLRIALPDSLKRKAFLGKVSSGGEVGYAGGRFSGDTLVAHLSAFGIYTVALDTVPPLVKPRFRDGVRLTEQGQLSFTVRDGLSGISRWEVYVDGCWAIGRYDAKYHKLWVVPDPDYQERGKWHRISVCVEDRAGNRTISEHRFHW